MIAKVIAVLVVLYLVYGGYMYITSGSSDITSIVTGPASGIWEFLRGILSGVGINL